MQLLFVFDNICQFSLPYLGRPIHMTYQVLINVHTTYRLRVINRVKCCLSICLLTSWVQNVLSRSKEFWKEKWFNFWNTSINQKVMFYKSLITLILLFLISCICKICWIGWNLSTLHMYYVTNLFFIWF